TGEIKKFLLKEGKVSGEKPRIFVVASMPHERQLSSADVKPPLSVGENIIRFVGSNTLGEKLVPLLAIRFMEEELKAKNVEQHPDPSDKELIYVTGDIGGKKQNIIIVAKGSGDAFKDEAGLTANPACDMGMSSRQIKDNESTDLQQKYGEWKATRSPKRGEGTENIIAMNGIAVIVHP